MERGSKNKTEYWLGKWDSFSDTMLYVDLNAIGIRKVEIPKYIAKVR